MSLPLLEGEVVFDDSSSLRARIAELEQEVADYRNENSQLQDVIRNLRKQLSPLHRALMGLFGMMDPVSEGAPASPSGPNSKRKVWESYVSKFGASSLNGRMISVLLEHGEATAQQLRVMMQCGNQSVYDTATRLNKLGLLQKNGSKYSLKEL